MQTPKYLLVTVLLAVSLAPVLAQDASEDEDRARALEELRQKMAELDSQAGGSDAAVVDNVSQIAAPAVEAETISAETIEAEPVAITPVQPELVQPKPVKAEAEVEVAPMLPVVIPRAEPVVRAGRPRSQLQASDAAIERAREDMRRKMAELDVQATAPARPTPPAAQPKPVKPAPAPAPVVEVSPAPATTPVPETVVASDEAIERARLEMRQKIEELNSPKQPTPRPSAPAKVVSAPKPQPRPQPMAKPAPAPVVEVAPAPAAAPAPETVVASDEAIERARLEMRQKIEELNSPKQPTPRPSAPAKVVSAPKPQPKPLQPMAAPAPKKHEPYFLPVTEEGFAVNIAPAASGSRREAEQQAIKTSVVAPAVQPATAVSLIQAPSPAVSVSKQQRLDMLLERYKADIISPAEYHSERAKILAEP